MKTTLGDINEDTLTSLLAETLRKPKAPVTGRGDDCAVLAGGLLLKTDCIVEGRHYLPETQPELIGGKAVNRVLSDFAAMGGWPSNLLITVGLRRSSALENVLKLYQGMDSALAPYDCTIVGGETVMVGNSDKEFISVSGIGRLIGAQPILRSGASIGDLIYVTGELGNTFETQHHLKFTPRLKEARWLVENTEVTAMMDISDGVARDLPRLASSSNVGYSILFDSLPLRKGAMIKSALEDGEDYELLFTIPSDAEHELRLAPFPLYCIGRISEHTPEPLSGGWDHLAGRR